jgi:hypothetical protein
LGRAARAITQNFYALHKNIALKFKAGVFLKRGKVWAEKTKTS